MVTKGYGITVNDIDWGCPSDFEPYTLSYKMERERLDSDMWTMGLYILSSLRATVGNMMMKKGAKPNEYMDKPLYQTAIEHKHPDELTEAEKQKAVDRFFAQEKARRVNWKRSHHTDDS